MQPNTTHGSVWMVKIQPTRVMHPDKLHALANGSRTTLLKLHSQARELRISECSQRYFESMFGRYLGEVIRRQFGGEWKIETE